MAENDIVLVVGGGGREYELARQLSRTESVQKVYVAPGNAGTAHLEKAENADLKPTDVPAITDFVRSHQITTVVIGPETALMAGLSNALRSEGINVFGASREAAMLETSKAFAADFMQRHAILQPDYWTARSLDEALTIIKDKAPDSYVIKADGLAGGKGVVLPSTADEAEQTLQYMFSGEGFDGAGKETVVIQERLHGPEVSAFAISDGENFILLPFAQDHKRLKDGDQGPNTGGMGVYAPLPSSMVNETQSAKIHTIAKQSITGMKAEGAPYQGVLYMGLMLAEERGGDPVVIEYNARFGDPETEVLLPALSEAGINVGGILLQTARGALPSLVSTAVPACVLTVCLAAAGYPENPRTGDRIEGLDTAYQNVIIHHAGTRQQDSDVVTSGGRVLYVTGLGATIDEAAAHAYGAIGPDGIHFAGMQYRMDIGYQARKGR